MTEIYKTAHIDISDKICQGLRELGCQEHPPDTPHRVELVVKDGSLKLMVEVLE